MTERKKMKACLFNHYKNMSKKRALKLIDRLNKKQKESFKKKINHCKKHEFVR